MNNNADSNRTDIHPPPPSNPPGTPYQGTSTPRNATVRKSSNRRLLKVRSNAVSGAPAKRRRRILRYIVTALIFVIAAVLVSMAAIWIKYAIIDMEAATHAPGEREYSSYYNRLSYKHQLLYDTIADAARNLDEETEILKYSYDMKEFTRILTALKADCPELFYVKFNELILNHGRHRTKVDMVYHDTEENVKTMISQYDMAVAAAMEKIAIAEGDFAKEVEINDYLAYTCSYSIGNDPLASTAYGALVTKEAFCDGYAYAAKQLFNKARIESCVIYGRTGDGEHVWNAVKIDGIYYHLDVMWNDANILSEKNLMFHGYFNLSDNEIAKDHTYTRDDGFLPEITGTDKDYYRVKGYYVEKKEDIQAVFDKQLAEAVAQKRDYIELHCTETTDNDLLSPYYSAAMKKINDAAGEEVLFEAFTVHNANVNNNALTIELFYN